MDTILSTIDDDETCDELEKDCGGHGCVLLQMFDTKLKSLISNGESNYGNTIAANVARILEDGLADSSVSAFNSFKTALNREIEIMPSDMAAGYPDSVHARLLVTAVNDLGPLISHV